MNQEIGTNMAQLRDSLRGRLHTSHDWVRLPASLVKSRNRAGGLRTGPGRWTRCSRPSGSDMTTSVLGSATDSDPPEVRGHGTGSIPRGSSGRWAALTRPAGRTDRVRVVREPRKTRNLTKRGTRSRQSAAPGRPSAGSAPVPVPFVSLSCFSWFVCRIADAAIPPRSSTQVAPSGYSP
jgi:hypothetical protein